MQVSLALQDGWDMHSGLVQEILGSASTGAAKVVARKFLDTLKREAVVFEDEQKALYAPAPSPASISQRLC